MTDGGVLMWAAALVLTFVIYHRHRPSLVGGRSMTDGNLALLLWAIVGVLLVTLGPPWWVVASYVLAVLWLVVATAEPGP